jgi:hypothetical protein
MLPHLPILQSHALSRSRLPVKVKGMKRLRGNRSKTHGVFVPARSGEGKEWAGTSPIME